MTLNLFESVTVALSAVFTTHSIGLCPPALNENSSVCMIINIDLSKR